MANNQRDPERERFWREVVERHASSGVSVREFFRREQLAETSFFAWRRTFQTLFTFSTVQPFMKFAPTMEVKGS